MDPGHLSYGQPAPAGSPVGQVRGNDGRPHVQWQRISARSKRHGQPCAESHDEEGPTEQDGLKNQDERNIGPLEMPNNVPPLLGSALGSKMNQVHPDLMCGTHECAL
jgi:hypothetical protein